MFYIPRIDGCIEPKTIVNILLFSRVHALTNACTLEDSKNFFYPPGYTHWPVRAPWRIVRFFAIVLVECGVSSWYFNHKLCSCCSLDSEIFKIVIKIMIFYKIGEQQRSKFEKNPTLKPFWKKNPVANEFNRYSWLQFTNNNVNAVSLAQAHR